MIEAKLEMTYKIFNKIIIPENMIISIKNSNNLQQMQVKLNDIVLK